MALLSTALCAYTLTLFIPSSYSLGCKKTMVFETNFKHKALIEHTFKSQRANDEKFCRALCFMDARCISCTFDWQMMLCHLSESDHIMHPEHLVDVIHASYWSSENTCNCSQKNMTCRFDFAENTHHCECPPKSIGKNCEIRFILGAKNATPAASCRAIRNAGDSKGDTEYWMKPIGVNTPFLVTCNISLLGVWKRVDVTMVSSFKGYGAKVSARESTEGGLVVLVNVIARGCGSPGSVSVVYINGYWTKIRYTQEFSGTAACWKIFGANEGEWSDRQFDKSIKLNNNGLLAFNISKDEITNERYMGGVKGHNFNGKTSTCNNQNDNFWHLKNSGIPVKSARVTLRRNEAFPLSGISTHTSCGVPSYVIKDIEVYF